MTIGGLCLEIYLVQMPILTGEERCLPFGGNTDDLLPLFPLNILVLLAIILMLAYLHDVSAASSSRRSTIEMVMSGKRFYVSDRI